MRGTVKRWWRVGDEPEGRLYGWASVVLRAGLGALWLWMGIVPKLLLGSEMWARLVEQSGVGLPAMPLLRTIGAFELALGVLLIAGWRTRVVAVGGIGLLAAIIAVLAPVARQAGISSFVSHLLIKNVPLMAAHLALVFLGAGPYSVDRRPRGA